MSNLLINFFVAFETGESEKVGQRLDGSSSPLNRSWETED